MLAYDVILSFILQSNNATCLVMRNFRFCTAACCLSFIAGLVSPVYAGWGQAKLIGPGNEGVIAVDATGESHILYTKMVKGTQNLVYTTYNTARARGKQLSLPLGVYGQLAMAVDSHGGPHVAVTTTDSNGIPTALSYLSLNGNVWQAQQVAGYVSTYSPLALDAQDNPHIAYFSGTNLTHAFYDGSEWQFEDTGLSIDPVSIKIAKDGRVYVAGASVNDESICEADGLNGVWNSTCLDSGTNIGGIGFAPNGSPEVAYIADQLGSIKLATFDGANSSANVIIDAGFYGVSDLRNLVFTTDSAGFGSVAFTAFGGGGGNYDLFYGHQQSDGTWAVKELVSSSEISFFQPVGVGMDVDQAGLPHIVFGPVTPIGNYEFYGAETLPALDVQWGSVTSAIKGGKTQVTGLLQVKNFGTEAAASFTIKCYLSADDQLDPSGTLVGQSAVALGAGQTKTMKFSFAKKESVSNEYLIASISTPNPQNEADTSTNVAVSQIL